MAITNVIRQPLQDLEPSQTALGSRLPPGVAVPAIMQQGIARSAANISDSWIGLEVNQFMTEQLGRPVSAINDADAAALLK